MWTGKVLLKPIRPPVPCTPCTLQVQIQAPVYAGALPVNSILLLLHCIASLTALGDPWVSETMSGHHFMDTTTSQDTTGGVSKMVEKHWPILLLLFDCNWEIDGELPHNCSLNCSLMCLNTGLCSHRVCIGVPMHLCTYCCTYFRSLVFLMFFFGGGNSGLPHCFKWEEPPPFGNL